MWQRPMSHRWLEDKPPAGGPDGHGGALRVLVESNHPVAKISDFSAFRMAGLDVAVCSGPGDDAVECPLVRGEPCRLAAATDAVLVELDVSRPSTALVIEALAAHHPGVPIVVEVP